jgi:hypothetical protein
MDAVLTIMKCWTLFGTYVLTGDPCNYEIQDVQMKGIQNKIIISQKALIIHICGLHHYQRKLLKFFSEYITFSVNFNVGFLSGMTNIQMIFDLLPRCMMPVLCYSSHSIPCAGFQVLKVVDLNLVDNVLHITAQEKIQWS